MVFKMLRFFILIRFMLFAYITMFPLPVNAGSSEATGVVKKFNSTLLESMKRASELGFSGRYDLLAPVIKETFALSFMAKKSVGRYWSTMQEDQQGQLLKNYTQWSIATYAKNFDMYKGEVFEVLPETEHLRGTVTVVSRLITPDGKNVDFHYRLRKPNSRWVIVDIQISGVSQLALTRSQFVRVIKHEGFDALIYKLQEKIRVLSLPVKE